jgi:enamine deaminase RidA (YjgF/YER057c/UK114 family)
MLAQVVLVLFCIFTIASAGICFRERDSCTELSNTPIQPGSRVISQAELRLRQCCARQSLKDRSMVLFAEPNQVSLSTTRDTPQVPQVFNPYATASLIAIAGNRVMLSATGSWDYLTGVQVPEGVERVNYAYAMMYKLGRAVGVAQEDLVQISVLAKGTENTLFNDFRSRANNITLADYGQTSATYPGRDFIGVVASEGATLNGTGADRSLNSFSTVAEFTLSCGSLRRWNLNCNVTQTIATIVTQTPEVDGFLTNRIRAFTKNDAFVGGCPVYTQPVYTARPALAWNNIINVEGAYLNSNVSGLEGLVTPSRVARIEIWALSIASEPAWSFAPTIASIRTYFNVSNGNSAQFPTLRYLNVRNLAQQDFYELGLRYYTGAGALEAQNTVPFPPLASSFEPGVPLPYSNAIRAGDYVYTTLFGGHNANGVLPADPAARVEQAYRNMLAAAAFFGADASDLYHVEAVSTDILRDQPAVDAASRLFFGAQGPFPTRQIQQQPALLLGDTFEVSGIFYSRRCRN